MSTTVRDLVTSLQPDPWRDTTGFSLDVSSALTDLFNCQEDKDQCASRMNQWIQSHQPCLFGRIAAKLGLITYCVLNEKDLQKEDEEIRAIIQERRTAWTREAFEGRKSGFVIVVLSSTIAKSLPNEDMKALSLRLCSLYLLQDIEPNQVCLEDVFLQMPGSNQTTWRWKGGVNYFSAQGDGRWWQDHRIPAGLAFSINSVGHMIKSGLIGRAMTDIEEALGAPLQGWKPSRIDSPDDALQYAMLTIDNASNGVSGAATELLPLPENRDDLPLKECPSKLPKLLENKNYCEYAGYYHTDYTIPDEYFSASVHRPLSTKQWKLDFTYLLANNVKDPDNTRLLQGQRIRSFGAPESKHDGPLGVKSTRVLAEQVQISNSKILRDALSGGKP